MIKRSQEIAVAISIFATYPNSSGNPEKLDGGSRNNLPYGHTEIGHNLLIRSSNTTLICKLCNFN